MIERKREKKNENTMMLIECIFQVQRAMGQKFVFDQVHCIFRFAFVFLNIRIRIISIIIKIRKHTIGIKQLIPRIVSVFSR